MKSNLLQQLNRAAYSMLVVSLLSGATAFGSETSTTAAAQENQYSLPPIDRAAPSEFATASFGLG
jgi:hypothetical protein